MTDPKTLDYQHIAVAEFMLRANQIVPIIPIVPPLEVRKLRARLILEEALETIHALGVSVQAWGEGSVSIDTGTRFTFHDIFFVDLQQVADGCADLKVVTVGTEIACGINGRPIFDEVMRSNFTKFIDGHMREDGKWQKGPSYEPPNIEPILRDQGMR